MSKHDEAKAKEYLAEFLFKAIKRDLTRGEDCVQFTTEFLTKNEKYLNCDDGTKREIVNYQFSRKVPNYTAPHCIVELKGAESPLAQLLLANGAAMTPPLTRIIALKLNDLYAQLLDAIDEDRESGRGAVNTREFFEQVGSSTAQHLVNYRPHELTRMMEIRTKSSPLDYAIFDSRYEINKLDVVKLLIEKGANISRHDKPKIFEYALMHNYAELAEAMIKICGIDPNAAVADSLSALHFIAESKEYEDEKPYRIATDKHLIDTLIANGADINFIDWKSDKKAFETARDPQIKALLTEAAIASRATSSFGAVDELRIIASQVELGKTGAEIFANKTTDEIVVFFTKAANEAAKYESQIGQKLSHKTIELAEKARQDFVAGGEAIEGGGPAEPSPVTSPKSLDRFAADKRMKSEIAPHSL